MPDPQDTQKALPPGALAPGVPARVDKYEVRGVLGAGTFGRVLLAFDPDTNRQVAIKQPFGEGLQRQYHDDFLKEARAAASVDHPNICPVYHVGTADGLPFIVMKFVAGGTLRALLDRSTAPLPVPTALRLVRKVALALAAAHAKGVIHRDLKPANVLCDLDNNEVLITDFGLARVTAASRAAGSLTGKQHGTPLYMPPEQWGTTAFGPITERADVYALGAMMYELLTGRPPFEGGLYELLAQHCTVPPEPPSRARPDLDLRLDALCLKALSKAQSDRYSSAKAFADALSAYLREGRSAEALEPGALSDVELVPAEPLPSPAPLLPTSSPPSTERPSEVPDDLPETRFETATGTLPPVAARTAVPLVGAGARAFVSRADWEPVARGQLRAARGFVFALVAGLLQQVVYARFQISLLSSSFWFASAVCAGVGAWALLLLASGRFAGSTAPLGGGGRTAAVLAAVAAGMAFVCVGASGVLLTFHAVTQSDAALESNPKYLSDVLSFAAFAVLTSELAFAWHLRVVGNAVGHAFPFPLARGARTLLCCVCVYCLAQCNPRVEAYLSKVSIEVSGGSLYVFNLAGPAAGVLLCLMSARLYYEAGWSVRAYAHYEDN